jgi:hypothetical protein
VRPFERKLKAENGGQRRAEEEEEKTIWPPVKKRRKKSVLKISIREENGYLF